MSPGQALVEIHPSHTRGYDDYVHAAVSLGVRMIWVRVGLRVRVRVKG